MRCDRQRSKIGAPSSTPKQERGRTMKKELQEMANKWRDAATEILSKCDPASRAEAANRMLLTCAEELEAKLEAVEEDRWRSPCSNSPVLGWWKARRAVMQSEWTDCARLASSPQSASRMEAQSRRAKGRRDFQAEKHRRVEEAMKDNSQDESVLALKELRRQPLPNLHYWNITPVSLRSVNHLSVSTQISGNRQDYSLLRWAIHFSRIAWLPGSSSPKAIPIPEFGLE